MAPGPSRIVSLTFALLVAACRPPDESEGPARLRAPLLGLEALIDAPITGAAAMNQSELAIGMGLNHWLLAWSDDRMSNQGSTEVWATRVSFDGGVLDSSGLSLPGFGSGPAVACLPDPCLVVWTTFSEARGMRVAADGGFLDASPIIIAGGSNEKRAISVATTGGGFLVAWAESVAGVWAINARQLALNAQPQPVTFAVSSGPGDRVAPVVIPSAAAEYWVAWTDYRGANADIYAARVTATNTVVPAGGVQVSVAPENETRAAGAIDPASETLLIAWDNSNDILGRRISLLNDLPIEAAPFVINNVPSIDFRAAVTWDVVSWLVAFESQGAGMSVVKQTRVVPGPSVMISDASGMQVTADGEEPVAARGGRWTLSAWIERGTAGGVAGVVTEGGDGGNPIQLPRIAISANSQFAPDVAGQPQGFLAVWEDTRSGRQRPATRALDALGNPLGATRLIGTSAGTTMRVAAGPGQYLVAWASLDSPAAVRAVRMSLDGTPLDAPSAAPAAVINREPAVAFGAADYLLVWTEQRATDDLYSMIIHPDGGNEPSQAFAATAATERNAAVAGNAAGWLVAWTELDRINVSRVDPSGARLDALGVTLGGVASARFDPSVATDGTGYLVAWLDNYKISVVRVLASGVPVDANPIILDPTVYAGALPHASWNGSEYVVTWRTPDGQVVGKTVPASGPVTTTPPMSLMDATPEHEVPRIAYSGDSAVVVATSYQRQQPIGSSRVVLRSVGLQPGGAACTIPLECRTGFCIGNVCTLADGGSAGGAGGGAGGGGGTGGTSGGTGGTGGGGATGGASGGSAGGAAEERSLLVGCACDASSGAAWLAILALMGVAHRWPRSAGQRDRRRRR